MEDQEILRLFFARDEQAIAEAKTKYGSVCRRIAENILHSREDAEECVNDVWVRTWNSIPPNRPERLLGYLAAITRNLALDRWRRENAACRRGSKPELAMEELGEILANSGNVEAEVEAEELAREISRFVQGLSARKRTIFIRRYFNVESLRESRPGQRQVIIRRGFWIRWS